MPLPFLPKTALYHIGDIRSIAVAAGIDSMPLRIVVPIIIAESHSALA